MEKLSERKEAVLVILDQEINELEKKLRKVQPLVDELNQLRATRRTLLATKGNTSGAGSPRTRLSMDEMIRGMQGKGIMTVTEIAEAVSVNENAVRSHLNRHKDTRYTQDNGGWRLTEEVEDGHDGVDEEDKE